MHIPTVTATPAIDSPHMPKDKGATPLEIGGERTVGPAPIERYLIPEIYREGRRQEAPPSPKSELDTTTHDKIRGDKTRIPPFFWYQRSQPSTRPRGGFRGGPPSSQTASRPRSQTRYGSYTHAEGAFAARNQAKRKTKIFHSRRFLSAHLYNWRTLCEVNKNHCGA